MRTTTVLNNHFMHYLRLAFLSGASTAFFCHSGVAQQHPEHMPNNGEGIGKGFTYTYTPATRSYPATIAYSNYHNVSTSTTPSYKYNITSFITTTLPVNKVQFSNPQALQMNQTANTIANNAATLSASANQTRSMARHASNRWQAVALCKKADSLEALSDNKTYEATQTVTNATESQYETNAEQLDRYNHNATYSTDILTSASLLNNEATIYYDKALTKIQQSDTAARLYIKQSFMDEARKDMETAVLKQQAAENIYISMQQNNSLALAKKIDSVLSVPEQAQPQPDTFGKVLFCVEVGSFKGLVPVAKANQLLKIAGLGITKHAEENGVTTFTIGQYANSTCAYMLSDELSQDGYTQSVVVTYAKDGGKQDTQWVVANK